MMDGGISAAQLTARAEENRGVISTKLIITPTIGAGSTKISPKDGMVMVYIPPGEFIMGINPPAKGGFNSAETPLHTLDLHAFWIDQTEITNAMFAKFVKETGYITEVEKNGKAQVLNLVTYHWYTDKRANWKNPSGQGVDMSMIIPKLPVVQVSWNDAKKYCEWADRRLPTEAEWEKAARGPLGNIYPWGNEPPLSSRLNFNHHIRTPSDIGIYYSGISTYGVFDMAGNVWEWVSDWYKENYYSLSPRLNPLGPPTGQYKILRGGSWTSQSDMVRSYVRYPMSPESARDDFGFRCASY